MQTYVTYLSTRIECDSGIRWLVYIGGRAYKSGHANQLTFRSTGGSTAVLWLIRFALRYMFGQHAVRQVLAYLLITHGGLN
jgi:hypothetical protein